MSQTTIGDESPEELRRQIAALQARLAAATVAAVNTQGGAAFQAPVEVTRGHLIGRDFIQIIQNLFPHAPDADRVSLALGAWLDALVGELAHPELGRLDPGIDTTRRQPLQLSDIYVPLHTTFNIPKGADLAEAVHAHTPDEDSPRKGAQRSEPLETEPATALMALDAHPALTLLGLPGSGKSTFGAHVLLAHAQAWQQLAPLAQSLGEPWRYGPLLPLRVVLRRFAERHARTQEALTVGHLWDHIAADLAARGWGTQADALRDVQTLARRHGALIVFDGLDECGDAAQRGRVQAVVQEFVQSASAGPRTRCLLTARPYAFPKGADPARGIYQLAPLDGDGMAAFVGRWYDALVARRWKTPAEAAALVPELQSAVHMPALRPLAENPLLLTMTALLHSNQKRLPDDRAELYDAIVELLLKRWAGHVGADSDLLRQLDIPGLTLGQVRSVLERVAFEAHAADVHNKGLAEIDESTLIQALRPLLAGSRDKAARVVEFIEERAGLLIGLGGHPEGMPTARRFSFPHRSFQEFLAACQLATRVDLAATCETLYAQSFDHFRLVLPLAARLAKAERGALAANELLRGRDLAHCPSPTVDDWQRAYAAATMLHEIGAGPLAAGAATTRQTLARVQQWLLAGLPRHPSEGGAPAPRRAEMGRVLGALGDARFDAARLHLPADETLGFVQIEIDQQFRIGTRQADVARVQAATGAMPRTSEINDELTPTVEFWIARYPVTVAQFGAYLAYTCQDWPNPASQRDPSNAPVRWVSWNDAMGYVNWLQQQLTDHAALSSGPIEFLVREAGWHADLPTELEWEKAARGAKGDVVFSWGDEADAEWANVHGSGIDTSSTVGCFAANWFNLHDMLGNLWEWTSSPWTERVALSALGHQAGLQVSSHAKQLRWLVRGGSWYDPLYLARCAIRNGLHHDLRLSRLGFRVVLRSAP